MCKRTESIVVEQTEDGRQFFNCGWNRYLIEGMPEIHGKQFFSFLDVPYAQRDSWNVAEEAADETLCADTLETDEQLEMFPFSFNIGGTIYRPFIRKDMIVIWIDEDQISPLSCEKWTILLRKSSTGEPYIAVKEGLYLVAVLKFKFTNEIMECSNLIKYLECIVSCSEMKMQGYETNDDVIGKLKELYE